MEKKTKVLSHRDRGMFGDEVERLAHQGYVVQHYSTTAMTTGSEVMHSAIMFLKEDAQNPNSWV